MFQEKTPNFSLTAGHAWEPVGCSFSGTGTQLGDAHAGFIHFSFHEARRFFPLLLLGGGAVFNSLAHRGVWAGVSARKLWPGFHLELEVALGGPSFEWRERARSRAIRRVFQRHRTMVREKKRPGSFGNGGLAPLSRPGLSLRSWGGRGGKKKGWTVRQKSAAGAGFFQCRHHAFSWGLQGLVRHDDPKFLLGFPGHRKKQNRGRGVGRLGRSPWGRDPRSRAGE